MATKTTKISTDGVSWTAVTSPLDALGAAASVFWLDYVLGSTVIQQFIAASSSHTTPTNVVTSPDGNTWTAISGTDPFAQGVVAIRGIDDGSTIGGTAIGVVGGNASNTAGFIGSSTDGSSFTNEQSLPTLHGAGRGIAYGGGDWVFGTFSESGTVDVYTSSDGVSWTAVASPFTAGVVVSTAVINCIGYNSSRFIAGGTSDNDHCIATSDNAGATWTTRVTGFLYTCNALAYSPSLGLWVAVGYFGGDSVETSSNNGTSWTAHSTPMDSGSDPPNAVAWSPALALFCAGTPTGKIYTSPDGVTWTLSGTPFTEVFDIAWSGELGVFVAVGEYTPAAAGGWVIGGVAGGTTSP